MPRCEKIGSHVIYFDITYFIAYAGGHRELPAKEQKEYDKVIRLPLLLQQKELAKIPLENNPNVVPVKGVHLLSFIRELKFVPFFDKFFEQTHVLKLTDIVIYESIRQKNYELAMRGEE
jgi:hypothetical protein